MVNYDCIAMMLSSVLSRINMISGCLSDDLSEEIDEVRFSITSVLKEHNYEVNLADVPSDFFLDMASLYKELNSISRDLGICILLVEHDELLEDAAYGVSFIIKEMANIDSVFGACYKEAKRRVLKY